MKINNLSKTFAGKRMLAKALAVLMLLCGSVTSAGAAEGFYVSGRKLMDANGKEFMMRGCNYSWAWQRGYENSVIPAAKRIGCNAIRIQLSTGKKWQKCSDSDLERLIKLCIDNKLVVMFNTHDETGSNEYSDLENACNFWIEKKNILNKYRKYVLLNISNEWCGAWNSLTWSQGYKKAIPKLRSAGIKNTLVVDCAGWGQYPRSIFDKGEEVAACDTEKNTIFSMHFYQDAAGSKSSVESNINSAMNLSVPVIIGEFSYQHKGKTIAWQKILDMTKEKKMGTLIWSWTGNGDGAEDCDMFSGYDDSGWKTNGTNLVKGKNGVKDTSVECSIFSNGQVDPDPVDPEPEPEPGETTASTVWTGSEVLDSWNNIVVIPASAFAKAKESDKVRLTFADCGATPQVQVALQTVAAWVWTQIEDCADIVGNTYVLDISRESPVDDTILAMLQAHGMSLKGQMATVTKVEILTAGGGSQGGGEETSVIHTANSKLTWSDEIQIPASAFRNAAGGDTLRFNFTDCGGHPQVQLVIKVGGEKWTELVQFADINGTTYSYVIPKDTRADYSVIETLKSYGMILKGQQATFTKLELVKSGTSAVESIEVADEAIDFDLPVEIYTLDGRRVAEFERGIYIVRQGNKVIKIAK